ncbi:unnamed protein product [Notodromas monacha]|uniref:Bestrophin homolog n=1 Tax=Notodromas monacha TaxID=399045 RepID=A0A7R9BLH7_9CRUS|nr:unnamed protein product [Notodromas monacha]CAG0917683.1 unnamed protein product [Notodromas monacha]
MADSKVVALAVYTFSLACLLGRQFLHPEKAPVDLVFPFFTVLQLVFYWGWLKVAEAMIDPYGEDDADFELNFYIDKNLSTSYVIADEAMQADFPELVKDAFWDKTVPEHLPHTAASKESEPDAVDLTGLMEDLPPTISKWRQSEETGPRRRRLSKRNIVNSIRRRSRGAARRFASIGAIHEVDEPRLCDGGDVELQAEKLDAFRSLSTYMCSLQT